MVNLLRQIWALLLGIAIFMLAYGLQGTLLGVRANLAGFSTATTGLVMSGYYLGMLLGSLRGPVLVARVGHVRVFAALLALASAAVLVHPMLVHPVAWFLLRLLVGYCFAGVFVVAESWLNGAASNANRGLLLSVYMVVQMGALAIGQFLLNLADPRDFQLFALVSMLVSVAAVPMLLTAGATPPLVKPREIGLAALYRLSPLGVVGVVGVGLAHSALYAMGPVYATDQHLSLAAVAAFMAAIVLGGVIFQLPLGRLSDRVDRRLLIAVVALLTAVAALPLALRAEPLPALLLPGFFVIGGLSLPLYAVCVAHTNDFLTPEQTVGASGALILGYGIGAAIGPTLVALTMQFLGPEGFPLHLALVHGVIGLFACYRMTRRPPVPATERGPFQPLPKPSSVVTSLAQESARDASAALAAGELVDAG